MGLLKLHDEKGQPVYVNPDYVTFVSKSPTSRGTVVGLVGDDLGCDVAETADQVARMLCPGHDTTEDRPEPPPLQQRQRRRFPTFRRGIDNAREEKGNPDDDRP